MLVVDSVLGSLVLDAVSWVQSSSEENFPVEGIFPLELTQVLTPSTKTYSDESINRGLVCAHMHSMAQTQKILTFLS